MHCAVSSTLKKNARRRKCASEHFPMPEKQADLVAEP